VHMCSRADENTGGGWLDSAGVYIRSGRGDGGCRQVWETDTVRI
jgi:hypothetical protein